MKLTQTFKILKAEVSNINKLLKNINIKKATGPDTIPPKPTLKIHIYAI